jgi:hypothetical protein
MHIVLEFSIRPNLVPLYCLKSFKAKVKNIKELSCKNRFSVEKVMKSESDCETLMA